MSLPSRTPSLAEVIKLALDARMTDMHVALPARVERYDATRQLVDVKPLLKQARTDEDGTVVADSLPMITNVPVVFPGANGFRITFPVKTGDTVLLMFADRSLDKWLTAGGEVDPIDLREHALSDAIAIVGLHPFNANWTGASTTNMTAGKDGGPQIHFKDSAIALGEENPTDAIALASKVLSELNAIRTAFNGHTHAVTTAPGVTATPLPAMGTASGVGSATIKAKD